MNIKLVEAEPKFTPYSGNLIAIKKFDTPYRPMTKSTEAFINHELLIWARQSAGLNLEQASKKVGVPEERLASWESGQNRPTINQLRKLANAYKRPLAVFYLPTPPRDFQLLRDYRQLTAGPHEPESPGLLLAVRRAWAQREIAIELYGNLDEKPPQFPIATSTTDEPEVLALKIRNELGISQEIQTGFVRKYEAFNWWRDSLESKGILVFQAIEVDISEMRGFSLTDGPLTCSRGQHKGFASRLYFQYAP